MFWFSHSFPFGAFFLTKFRLCSISSFVVCYMSVILYYCHFSSHSVFFQMVSILCIIYMVQMNFLTIHTIIYLIIPPPMDNLILIS